MAAVLAASLAVCAIVLLAPAVRLPAPGTAAALGTAAVVAVLATTAVAEIRAAASLGADMDGPPATDR